MYIFRGLGFLFQIPKNLKFGGNMRRLITLFALALACLLFTGRAKADNITFTLPASPTSILLVGLGDIEFEIPVPYLDNGVPEVAPAFETSFFSIGSGGGFVLDSVLNVGHGCCQVFSELAGGITFDPGTYVFTGIGGTGTLTITAGPNGTDNFSWTTGTVTPPTGVPEPSSLFLLSGGLGTLGLWLKRRA
jgi:PEP-CTERM motif